jgi:mRNA export factor
MSGEFPLLVTAHSENYIHYWDLQKIFQGNFNPQGVTISPLKYPTTAIHCFADGKGYCIISIEGRCGVKNVNLATNNINPPEDYCFKCHRVEENGIGKVYTTNGMAFNKAFGTFATYGNDGCYLVWNKDTKTRLKSTKPAPWPITAADFLENGTLFAFAFGYDYSKGAEGAKMM